MIATFLNDRYETGYYGIPGKNGGFVHITKNGKPLCGMRPHPKAEFQWCAHGIRLQYVECKRCKQMGFKLEKVNLEKIRKQMEQYGKRIYRKTLR